VIASASCSFDGLDLISSLSSGSLRATIWKKSAGFSSVSHADRRK
jgi:hypothetical protein